MYNPININYSNGWFLLMNGINSFIKINERSTLPELDIFLSTDGNYIPYCGVCIYSIHHNNKSKDLRFHILTKHVSADDISKIEEIGAQVFVYDIDDSYFLELKTSERFPISIYYRVIAPRIVSSESSKILYLDCDILCDGDISNLINLDMGEKIMAAAFEDDIKDVDENLFKKLNSKKYFNSGVLLIDNKKWISNNVEKKFMDELSTGDYCYPDQDSLNVIFDGDVFPLSNDFNFIPKNSGSVKKNKPVLIHYAGSTKPWSKAAMPSYHVNLYKKYFQSSPWRYTPYKEPSNDREYIKYGVCLLMRFSLLKGTLFLCRGFYKTLRRK